MDDLRRKMDAITTMALTVQKMRARDPGLGWRETINVLVAVVSASGVDPLAVAAHLETVVVELREPNSDRILS